jgi:plasmid maintenance system antidote protein VapI
MARRRTLLPIHPGELFKDELQEINVSLNELTRALRVPMNWITAIVNGRETQLEPRCPK